MLTRSSLRITHYALLAALLVTTGQGCLSSGPTALDGGVFKTADTGATWQHPSALNLGGKLGSIADVGTVSMATDPQDPQALYVGTAENGLIASLDGGDSWAPVKGMSVGRVNAILVNPKDKCTIYTARANQIFKTTDCMRDWNQVYFDSRLDKTITALAIDWFNPEIVYAGSSDGDVFKSDNGGQAWRATYRTNGVQINSLAVDPRDSRTVYAATNGAGVLKTADGGQNWQRIYKPFQDYNYARRPVAVVVDPRQVGIVYAISKYGLIKTEDTGVTWKPITLPTPSESVDLRAFAIHPQNSKILVYATDASIVVSLDGGKTWSPKKAPTTRGISFLQWVTLPQSALYVGAAVPKN